MVRQIRYPTGVRPLLMEAAARRKRVERRFVEALDAAGFDEIILPVLDYVEPYEAVATSASARRAYRFIDREGDLVALRSDFTPVVARALAPVIGGAPTALRVYYRGDVIRCDRSRLGASREMFQIGAEIVGDDSIAADLAILELAARLAGDATIVYTDARMMNALADASPATREALVSKRSSGDPLAERLLGGSATIADVRSFAPDAADRLAAIAASLDSRFLLHLGELDEGPSYYTGIRFAVYAGPARSKIAQGGRYDNLYERLGAAAPAVGFTFTIDDLD